MFYELTLGLVKDNVGKKGEFYFPFIYVLYTFFVTKTFEQYIEANSVGIKAVADIRI